MPYNALETFKLLMFGGKKFNLKKNDVSSFC